MPAIFFKSGLHLGHVQCGGHAVHRRRGAGAEQVLVARILENARRSAIEEDRQLLELLGNRGHCEAIAAGDVADHHIRVVALDEIAVFVDLLRRAAGLVDEDSLDRRAGEPLGGMGRGKLAGIERFDDHLGPVARRYAERASRRSGQERNDADLDRLFLGGRVGRRNGERQRRECGGEGSGSAR